MESGKLQSCSVVMADKRAPYITHVYANGKYVGGAAAQVQDSQRTIAPQEASLADGYYEVSVEGMARTVQEVRFPSWTANIDQDDLENPWIIGEKIDDTTWRIRAPFSKHNFENRKLRYSYLLSFDKYGNRRGIGGAMIYVNGSAGGSTEADLSGVSYEVFMYGVNQQAQHVYFPTWTAKQDQDDTEWIEGVKVANGVWRGTVVYAKHNSETGPYITHIYADGTLIGDWSFNVTDAATIQAPQTAVLGSLFYDVTISGVPSNVTDVKFPTWTDSNGQDDIQWTSGERISPTSWRARIPFYIHNNETGTYITHIYAYDAYGNHRAVGGVTVTVEN